MRFTFAPAPASALSSVSDAAQWLIDLPFAIFRAYSSLLEWAADAIADLFDSYGYWVVFLGTLFENTLLLGLIVPGLIVVLLSGIAAHDGYMNPVWAAALGIAGTVIGDTISYFMGRLGWARFGNGESLRTFSEKVREPLMQRGQLFVLVYHFAGYTRVVGPAAAGLLRMPYLKWAVADHLGAVLWVCTFLGIGYGLGAAGITLDSTDDYFRYVEWAILVLVVLWMMFVVQTGGGAVFARLNEAFGGDGGDDDDDGGTGSEHGPSSPGGDEPEREVVRSGAGD